METVRSEGELEKGKEADTTVTASAVSTHWLVGLSSTLVTRVRCHGHHWLHLGCPGNDASHGDESPDVVSLDLTHRERVCA